MDKRILDIVNDFAQWKGDTYRLAVLIAVAQNEIDKEKLIAAELPDAAAVI